MKYPVEHKIYTYTKDQQDIINEMVRENIYVDYESNIALIMATHCYARAKHDLIGILQEYPNLTDKEQIEKVVDDLVVKEYLSVSRLQQIDIYSMNETAFQKYLKQFHSAMKKRIIECKNMNQNIECVDLYGKLTGSSSGGHSYTSFIQRIKDAQYEILMPMLNTEPHEATIEALKLAAEKGVRIYLMFADEEKVVSKLRHKRYSTLEKWMPFFKQYNNVQFRVYTHIEDAILNSSLVIDQKIVRICVHDPLTERSSAGTLLEAYKPHCILNLVLLVRDRFFDIWMHSYNPQYAKVLRIFLNIDLWVAICGVVMFVLGFIASNVWSSIFVGLATSATTYLLTKYHKRIGAKVKNIVRAFKT